MTPESYHTIAKDGEGYFKDKGSRFYGFAFECNSEEEVRERLAELRKKFHDARHHCYAYLLGVDGSLFRANDDGEPSHSAGDPILGQIKSRELSNTLVVVIRYFGGTKLGVSGLIQAYKAAASDALEDAGRTLKYITQDILLEFKYPQMNEVMKLVKNLDLLILEQDFQLDCKLKLRIRPSQLSRIEDLEEVNIIL